MTNSVSMKLNRYDDMQLQNGKHLTATAHSARKDFLRRLTILYLLRISSKQNHHQIEAAKGNWGELFRKDFEIVAYQLTTLRSKKLIQSLGN
jgi:hypothetical protein